jgi:hypothetical protein
MQNSYDDGGLNRAPDIRAGGGGTFTKSRAKPICDVATTARRKIHQNFILVRLDTRERSIIIKLTAQ